MARSLVTNKCELTVLGRSEQLNDILSCHYDSEGKFIYSGSINGELVEFESRSLKDLHRFVDEDMKHKHNPVTSVNSFKWNGENKLLSSHASGWTKLWDVETKNCLLTLRERAQVMGAVPHLKKERILTLSEDAKMRLYDMNTGQLTTTYKNCYSKEKMTGHASKIFAAKFHPQRVNEFISGGWDDTVHFWDMRKAQSLRYFAGAHICGEGLDIDVHGEIVLACSYQQNKSCTMWDYASAKPYMELATETSRLYCGKYMGAKFLMTGGSDPGNLRIINLYTYGTIAIYKSSQIGVYCLDLIKESETKDNIINCRIIVAAGSILSELECHYIYAT